MATEDSVDVPGWLIGPDKRRVLEGFTTNYGTKLFVENGLLVEEKIQSHGNTVGTAGTVGLPQGISYDAPNYPVRKVEGQEQTIDSAKAALKHYNTRNDTHYVLVNPINSNCFSRSGKLWIHSSFTAKADTSTETSQADPEKTDTSTETSKAGPEKAELFFAEVMIAGFDDVSTKYVTTACRVLDESEAIDHCEICPPGLKGSFSHPKSKFRQGCYKYISRALRPRSNGKVLKRGPYSCRN